MITPFSKHARYIMQQLVIVADNIVLHGRPAFMADGSATWHDTPTILQYCLQIEHVVLAEVPDAHVRHQALISALLQHIAPAARVISLPLQRS